MPTKNPRINVALEKPIYALIERLAQDRGLSLPMMTRDLRTPFWPIPPP
jgi:hypothetical protein